METVYTYQQWLDCFRRLEEKPWDQALLDSVTCATYQGKPSEMFLVRLSETVSKMLGLCMKWFLREIDRLLSENETDMATLVARRFRKRINGCFFYRNMEFLPASYIRTLDEGFEKQINAFWKDFLRQLDNSARTSMNPNVEEMAYELRRMKIISIRGQYAAV